jgi:hypothetical protein
MKGVIVAGMLAALSATSSWSDTGISADSFIEEQAVDEEETTEDNTENSIEIVTGSPYIIDLDFSTDVDDACAIRVATTLDKQGIIDLKAMMLCVSGENNVKALNGLLNYDGYGSLPIGTDALGIYDESPYWDILSAYSVGDGNINVQGSVSLYRKILAESNDKVTIVTTGYLTNIAELLKSQPDDYSDKNGIELVRDKVRAIYVTGGAYPSGWENNLAYNRQAIDATVYTVNNCEAPLVFVTSNNGAPFTCGGLLQQTDTERNDPLSKALDAFGVSDGRAAWDPFTVWVSAIPLESSHMNIERCTLNINADTGENEFITDENGNVQRMNRVDNNYTWYREQLDALTIQN